MYAAGPGQAQSTKSADLEAFLLGKRRVDTLLNTGDEKKVNANKNLNLVFFFTESEFL